VSSNWILSQFPHAVEAFGPVRMSSLSSWHITWSSLVFSSTWFRFINFILKPIRQIILPLRSLCVC